MQKISKNSIIVPFLKRKFAPLLLTFFSLVAIISLHSYAQNDYNLLLGGLSSKLHIFQNKFGYLGAWLSYSLFLTFGAVSFPISYLMCLCGIRNLFFKNHDFNWEYFLGLLLFAFGLSIFVGIWPDCLVNELTKEVVTLPDGHTIDQATSLSGGVIGQRFASQETGWLRLIVNPTGTAIISGLMTLAGIVIIWANDWHNPFKLLLKKLLNSPKTSESKQAIITEKRPEPEPAKEDPSTQHTEKVKRPGFFAGVKGLFRASSKAKTESNTHSGFFSDLSHQPQLPGTQQNSIEPSPIPITPAPAPIAPVAHTPAPTPRPVAVPQSSAASGVETKFAQSQRATNIRSTVTVNTDSGKYTLPELTLLSASSAIATSADPTEIEQKKLSLQHTLESFKIDAQVCSVTAGPRVTLFELMTAPGVNLNKITSLSANISMNLKAQSLRIMAPIPGKNTVGIEVPNRKAAPVGIRGLLEDPNWQHSKDHIPLTLGRDISGNPIILDLAKAPHLMIAGATGSGKSVCMNTIIASMLYRFSPDELKLILIDPKVVEFKGYEKLPHLVVPVISDVKQVTMALHWAVKEMERRYKILAQCGVKNLDGFNNRKKVKIAEIDHEGNPVPDKLPFLVIIIDELADIMMTAKGDVETSLARIAQLGRASGIHTIIATQRPSVNVITGIIKANFPTRIAFKVTSVTDSRTILDGKGAEQLLGMGDMLFNPPGASTLLRVQGAYVPESELENVVEVCSNQIEQQFDESIILGPDEGFESDGDMTPSPGFTDSDLSAADEELVRKAIAVIIKDQRATTSYVQRQLRIGYNKAATIMEVLEERGMIGPQIGTAPREILAGPPNP